MFYPVFFCKAIQKWTFDGKQLALSSYTLCSSCIREYFLRFNIIKNTIFFCLSTANIPSKTPPPRSETFSEIQLGKSSTFRIGAFGYWNYQFHLRNPSLVKFNYTLSSGASLGVYGRRDGVPTHTRYDFFEILKPKNRRTKRSEKVSKY